jgi:hypothetical protein
VIRAGDHDKESVDVHTSLDFHASDWTTLHDETFPTPADFDVSAKVESLHECFDEIGNFNEETANSEASESDRKFSPQERQLFHELDEDDESIQSDRDFTSPHAEQERQRETAGTMEQGKGISDAPTQHIMKNRSNRTCSSRPMSRRGSNERIHRVHLRNLASRYGLIPRN